MIETLTDKSEISKFEATTPTAAMTREDFVKSTEFRALTESQQKWILIFIETADAARATREIYRPKPDAYVAMLTRKLETSPRILAALDLFYGRSPKEKFVRDLHNDIARLNGVAKIQARKLYAEVTGLIDDAPIEAEGRFKVGDICVQDGKKYRVTSLDPNGSPLTADEVIE